MRAGGIGAHFHHGEFMMVPAMAGEKHHLEPRLLLHDLEAENLAVKLGRAREVAHLDYRPIRSG